MDIAERAYDYSVRVAELVRYLKAEGKDFPLSDKLLDCAVSAGLSTRTPDRKAAADSVREADYLIEMAAKAGYLTQRQAAHIREDGKALLSILEENG